MIVEAQQCYVVLICSTSLYLKTNEPLHVETIGEVCV